MGQPTKRPDQYGAAHFTLELDGKVSIGIFRSIDGGNAKTEVMSYQQGGFYDRWRQLGRTKFDDIKIQVGMAAPSVQTPFFQWIADFFDYKAGRKDGVIVAGDFYYKERARREFKEALITEIQFPKLEGKDTSAAYLTVSLAVENIVYQPGNQSNSIGPPTGYDSQKLWTANNFRFTLNGFEDACRAVTKVDGFNVKQQVAEYHAGGLRSPTKTPIGIDYPTIAFYLPEGAAQPFMKYYTDRAIKGPGGNRPGDRLHGSIVAFDDERNDLFELQFTGSDIASITVDKADSSVDEIKQVKVEIYTEKMKLDWKKVPA
jgi:phage tail-like protein